MALESIYTRDYALAPPIIKTPSAKPVDRFAERFDDTWLDSSILNAAASFTAEEQEEIFKAMWKRRYRSVYICDYSREHKKISDPKDDIMMNQMASFFEKNVVKGKVLPPLPSARRVLEYASENQMRTPLTTYQNVHDRVGYMVLKTHKKRVTVSAEKDSKSNNLGGDKNDNKQLINGKKVKNGLDNGDCKTDKSSQKCCNRYCFIASGQPQNYTFEIDPSSNKCVMEK